MEVNDEDEKTGQGDNNSETNDIKGDIAEIYSLVDPF